MYVLSKDSSRKRARLASALLGLAMLGAGCGQQKSPVSPQELDSKALTADSLHMARLYGQWEQTLQAQGTGRAERGSQMPIDLADDAQYRFVQNRLRASGSTPQNSPQLFRRLEKLRKEKKAGIPGTMTREDMLSSTTTETTAEAKAWCGHLLPLTDVDSADTTVAKFQATGLVSCFNGSDYAYTDVTAYAADATGTQFRVLGTQSFEEYAGAVLETPPLDLNLKVNPGEQLVVDSVAVAFNEATGESHVSYTMAESSVVVMDTPDVNTLDVKHPTELVGRHMQDNPIRTCLERGGVTGYLDCDYASGSKDPVTGLFKPFAKPFTGVAAINPAAIENLNSPWRADTNAYWQPAGAYDISRLYIPMRGTHLIRLPQTCTVDAVTSDATVLLMQQGGWCAAGKAAGTSVLKGSIPYQTPYRDAYDPNRLVIPFDGLGDFGRDCLDHMQNVRLILRSTLRATCINQGTGKPQPYTRTRIRDIMTLDFRNACLAEGTKVVKADGKSVAVEQVKVGDKLLANGKGQALTVTTVSRGGESKPMVKLLDARGGEVMVTQTHPMVTATRGVVQAGELKVGDALLTRTGTAKLVGVERVPYQGEVFNFALGTPEELAQVAPEARTLYANDYLVGDSHMQSWLEKQRALDGREVLSRLNGAWHEDYRLHQAKQKRAGR